MEQKVISTTSRALNQERIAKRTQIDVMDAARRNITDKWYLQHKVDFGNITNFYQIRKEVGRGANAVCYEAFLLNPQTKQPTLKKVAIKAFYRTFYQQMVLMEVLFLKLVRDTPNVVKLENLLIENNQFFVITNFYPAPRFERIMYTGETHSLPMCDIKSYMYALLQGLANLHELGIVHRDIKQGNFLYNPETRKGILIDFGNAEISPEFKSRILKDTHPNPKRDLYRKIFDLEAYVNPNKFGTQGFMPPEQVLKKNSQSYGIDIWAAGVVFLEFLTSKHPLFKNLRIQKEDLTLLEYPMGFLCSLGLIFGAKKVEEICSLCDFQVTLPEEITESQTPWRDITQQYFRSNFASPECFENCHSLLDQMLRLNPSERISAKDALRHSFFADVR